MKLIGRVRTSHCPIDAVRRLVSQPQNVRHGIPRRMPAQHQTQMTVHVRKLNRGMNNNNQGVQKSPETLPPAAMRPVNAVWLLAFGFAPTAAQPGSISCGISRGAGTRT